MKHDEIHYKQRVCEDRNKIDAFLQSERIGVLGLCNQGKPYAVPLNFVWENGCVYFHGMGSGRKMARMPVLPFFGKTVR